MKGLLIISACFISLFYSNLAVACGSLANGISYADLQVSMQSIENKLKSDATLSNYTIEHFMWKQINSSTGIEGDCRAFSVDAVVNIKGKNKDGQNCVLSTEVVYINSRFDDFKYFDVHHIDTLCL